MRDFKAMLAMDFAGGKLFVLREVEMPEEVGLRVASMDFKAIRYVSDPIHIELSSIAEFPEFLRWMKVDLFEEFESIVKLGRFVAAAAFDEDGELVESQPLFWRWGDPTAAIEWDRHAPRVSGDYLVFLGEYWTGKKRDNTHRIYEVSCNLITFEVQRTELASYELRLP
jgi:hypothetical protein